jgi:N-acetylglucosamine kinase-like BadF-type ATPase
MSIPKISETIQTSIGAYGGKYSGAATITPATGFVFVAVQVISDAVITLVGDITGITGVTVYAGTIIYGRYTSITIASGSVIAYNGV